MKRLSSRWRSLLLASLGALGVLGTLACGAHQPPPPDRIILVVIDTLRHDHLSCYGGDVPTPRIDALAARGQRFTNAIASFHQTTMSMGALFTGLTPSIESGDGAHPLAWRQRTWCGMARFAPDPEGRGPCLPRSVPTLGEGLRAAGYETLGVASNPLLFGGTDFRRGFDDWSEVGEARAERPKASRRERLRPSREEQARWAASRAADRVNAAVSATLDRRRSDRFFLYVHYMDVHDYILRRARYQQGVAEVDAAVGSLMDELQRRGLLAGTAVVLTADHGERLKEVHPVRGGPSHHGNPSFESVLRVPLIIAPPLQSDLDLDADLDHAPEALVRSEDLHRILLRLAGSQAAPPSVLGPDELLVTEMHWRTYRSGRWKSAWSRRDGRTLLFDLETDPGERRDRSGDQPDILARHGRRIATLASQLTAGGSPAGELTDEERERLRVLGYLDERDEPAFGSAEPPLSPSSP